MKRYVCSMQCLRNVGANLENVRKCSDKIAATCEHCGTPISGPYEYDEKEPTFSWPFGKGNR